jgi:hypothetical protein
MNATPVDFGRVADRPLRERRGIVPPADAPEQPGFELNRPLRELRFEPRRPKFVQPLFPTARTRVWTS